MSEMFETVNANAAAAQQEERERKDAARRAIAADQRMVGVMVLYLVIRALGHVLHVHEHISADLAVFWSNSSTFALAIWIGAWAQLRFCGKGLLK